jgi:hypothetical protein
VKRRRWPFVVSAGTIGLAVWLMLVPYRYGIVVANINSGSTTDYTVQCGVPAREAFRRSQDWFGYAPNTRVTSAPPGTCASSARVRTVGGAVAVLIGGGIIYARVRRRDHPDSA